MPVLPYTTRSSCRVAGEIFCSGVRRVAPPPLERRLRRL